MTRAVMIAVTLVMSGFTVHGAIVGYWLFTGHCCGDPIFTADWDNCLPVQDTYWPARHGWVSGHCDKHTWKRVIP